MNRKTVIAIVSALFMVAGLIVAARSGIRMYRVHNATPVSELEVSELKEGQWLAAQVDEVLDWYAVKKTGTALPLVSGVLCAEGNDGRRVPECTGPRGPLLAV